MNLLTPMWLALAYDLVAKSSAWDELAQRMGEDARWLVENDLLLRTAKLQLRYDAYWRISPWKLYHNTQPYQSRGLIPIKANRSDDAIEWSTPGALIDGEIYVVADEGFAPEAYRR